MPWNFIAGYVLGLATIPAAFFLWTYGHMLAHEMRDRRIGLK